MSSPGVSGPQCGQCLGLTTRDRVRQETPGAPIAGAGYKGQLRKWELRSWEGRRRRPT
jgi:hypothetical protein